MQGEGLCDKASVRIRLVLFVVRLAARVSGAVQNILKKNQAEVYFSIRNGVV